MELSIAFRANLGQCAGVVLFGMEFLVVLFQRVWTVADPLTSFAMQRHSIAVRWMGSAVVLRESFVQQRGSTAGTASFLGMQTQGIFVFESTTTAFAN